MNLLKKHAALLRLTAVRFCLLGGLTLPLQATTYYVDYAGGNNTADGLNPQNAWKHAPGDSAANGKPASLALAAGDTVIFKGGIAYFGAITLATSGNPAEPITYDGNSAGSFGKGRAIVDGGTVISTWRRVASADEVKGNPRWQEIFYADIDVDITSNTRGDRVVVHRQAPVDRMAPWQRIMLSDGDQSILPVAQHPKPKDAFFPDLPRDFLLSPHKLEVRKTEGVTLLTDPQRFTSRDPRAYEGTMVGIHGGNNHVYFADIKSFDPAKNQISFPAFDNQIYEQTRYALYNSPRFIEQPGEWSIAPLGDGRSRIFLLPLRLENNQPANVAYPAHGTGITVTGGHSHLRIQGFLIQRFSGGQGGVSVIRNTPRARNITIADNEIRFVSGHAGIGLNYADDVEIRNNTIRHCPGWTTGIFLNRVTGFKATDNRLDKNSGSGIRLYEGLNGTIARNTVLDHYGMHSSGMNLYEGCTDVVVEDNFIENVITINRNAERLVIRNNVVDAQNSSPVTLTIWGSGRTRGTAARDIQVLNNTFVNTDQDTNWSNGFFGQSRSGVSPAEGIVVRGNIMDRPRGTLNGVFENNIYLRAADAKFMGAGTQVVADMKTLFRDPEKRDFRRRPGGPALDIGATLPPPPAN